MSWIVYKGIHRNMKMLLDVTYNDKIVHSIILEINIASLLYFYCNKNEYSFIITK